MLRIRQSHCLENVKPLPLSVERVDIHTRTVSAVRDLKSAWTCLSPEEVVRAERFHFEADRLRYVVAHAELRRLLSAYLAKQGDVLLPQQLVFREGEHGKPELVHTIPLQFNLSHAQDEIAIAVGLTHAVGIDVEAYRSSTSILDLAKRFFTREEFSFLANTPVAEQPAKFYWLWTRKEAVIKATGRGLAQGLETFSVLSDQVILHDTWQLHSWSVHETAQATVCVHIAVQEICDYSEL